MKLHSPLARRRGLTLTEALVAMFIAAIGMIALLTLFPLGALQMAQAIKDARCTEAAINAESSMRSHWRNEITDPLRLSDPVIRNTINSSNNIVFVDPIGVVSGLPGTIAGHGNITRQTLGVASVGPGRPDLKFCGLLDDMTFNESGVPVVTPTSGRIERAGRYNWSAVLQRSNLGVSDAANLSILVFDGRAPSYPAPNAEVDYRGWDEVGMMPPTPLILPPGGPAPRYSLITPNSTSMQLKFPTGATSGPALAKGRWVGLYTDANRLLTFHRVVSVTETSENRMLPAATDMTIFTLELQTPVGPGHAGGVNTTAIVFAGLAEVFERPNLTGR